MFCKLLAHLHLPLENVTSDLVYLGCGPLLTFLLDGCTCCHEFNFFPWYEVYIWIIPKWNSSPKLSPELQTCISKYLWAFPLWRFTGTSNSACLILTSSSSILSLLCQFPFSEKIIFLSVAPGINLGQSWLHGMPLLTSLSHPNLSNQPQRATSVNFSISFEPFTLPVSITTIPI